MSVQSAARGYTADLVNEMEKLVFVCVGKVCSINEYEL
jgi:hypothetical protein